MAKETFYFSHDYNARNDTKIKRLLSVHGYLGYGIFWAIIEDLYNNTNVLRLDYDSISFDLRTTPEVIKSIVNDFDFFVIEGDSFSSISVKNRIDARNSKSVKARESINKRWEKYERNTNVLQSKYDANTIKESKVKESKVKENKIKINIPTEIEFLNYCKDFMKDKFQSYEFSLQAKYAAWVSDGWKDGNKAEIKNWKTKISNTIPYLKPISFKQPESKMVR